MRKLSALFLSFLILFSLSACGNKQSTVDYDNGQLIVEDKEKVVEEEKQDEPIEPKPDEDETTQESETKEDVWTPFTEDSDGRLVFTDTYFFEPLSLLGYIITEDGDVFIPTEEWEECSPEFFAEHVFGTWLCMMSAAPTVINELYETESRHRKGDVIIYLRTDTNSQFYSRYIYWLDINNPDIIHTNSIIGDLTENGWDINVNVYKDYIASPMPYFIYRAPVVTLPAGWAEQEFWYNYYIPESDSANISVLYMEPYRVYNLNLDGFSIYEGTNYDVYKIADSRSEEYIITDGIRYFRIVFRANTEAAFNKYQPDAEFLVNNFALR
jgi:hypothetical protein